MYNINDLAEEHPNLTLGVRAADLEIFLDRAIERAKKEFSPEKEELYVTTEKAAKMLGVDRSTLWRWRKSSYLAPIEVGGKRMYRESDIRKILEGGNK